ncbi:hypothetical protein niasHT_021816 [Heterodera trifolii]|uniref:histone acetyltransferase n=1 Tax=Heterodera trifolii TaxID=157864 RepID=A0ABD2J8S4_9BILA
MNNTNSGGPPQMLGAGSGAGQPRDPEKRKLIQQQLVLLLHAQKCQQIERSEPLQNRAPCTLPYCSLMKGVLEHMVGCSAGRQCQYAHCASSRQIIAHWKDCRKDDCSVCNVHINETMVVDPRQADIMLSAIGFHSVTLPQGAIDQQQQQPMNNTNSGGPPQMRGGGIAQQQQTAGNHPQQMLGAGGGQPQDPEKRKLIQQQLVLLLHAHKCQQIERSELRQNHAPCTLPYCSVMKGVLEHMVGCSAGRQCQYAHCASSRQIIAHWKDCRKDDCPVCSMVKRYINGTAADRRQADIMLSSVGFSSVTLAQGAVGQQQPSSSASICSGPSSVGSTSILLKNLHL